MGCNGYLSLLFWLLCRTGAGFQSPQLLLHASSRPLGSWHISSQVHHQGHYRRTTRLRTPSTRPSYPEHDDALFMRKTRSSSSALFQQKKGGSSGGGGEGRKNGNNNKTPVVSPVLREASRLLQRTSWFSWWCQTILTVVSCTILLFASNAAQNNRNADPPSFFLSALGVAASFLSILWTWGNGARLSRRLLRDQGGSKTTTGGNTNNKPFAPAPPSQLLGRAIRVQVSVNLVGLFLTLLAAEQIVGSLALKVLTAGGTLYGAGGAAPTTGWVQPLDILIVQANTNTLLSHFASLTSSLYLADRVRLPGPNNSGGPPPPKQARPPPR